MGTPLAKPFDCKIWVERAGGRFRVAAGVRIVLGDIVMMPRSSGSQCSCLSVVVVRQSPMPKTKNPAYSSVSRVVKIGSSLYLLTLGGFRWTLGM
jgi:hypothetical protein